MASVLFKTIVTAHLVAFVDLLQPAQAADEGVWVLQVAGRAFLNMHVGVGDAVDVHHVFASGHNDVGGSGVAEHNVLVLDDLGSLVPFVWRNVVEAAGSEEGFRPVTAVCPFAVGKVERCGQVRIEGRVVGGRHARGWVFRGSPCTRVRHRRLRRVGCEPAARSGRRN